MADSCQLDNVFRWIRIYFYTFCFIFFYANFEVDNVDDAY